MLTLHRSNGVHWTSYRQRRDGTLRFVFIRRVGDGYQIRDRGGDLGRARVVVVPSFAAARRWLARRADEGADS